MAQKFRFGFLYLDELHHVNHFVTIAIKLAETHHVEIITYPGEHAYLRNTLDRLQGEEVIVTELKTHWFRALTDSFKNRRMPRKVFWMKKNKNYLLNNFDALVFTSYIHHKLLKYRGSASSPKFIKVPHGMAGRGYSFHNDLLDFDLSILFGPYHYEQLKKRNLLGNRTEVAGYFKPDALKNFETPKLFNNEKPVVLYNPHFTKGLSSWYDMGEAVLDFFKTNKKYNLIFAPHINLFNRRGGLEKEGVLKDLESYDHILVDLGSEASVDMVYLDNADIYLGDVSSQSLEIMMRPRPCIFINSHTADYEDNPDYRFWQAGEVIDSVSALANALDTAAEKFTARYKTVQEQLDHENRKTEKDSTATERAAAIMETYLKESPSKL